MIRDGCIRGEGVTCDGSAALNLPVGFLVKAHAVIVASPLEGSGMAWTEKKERKNEMRFHEN